MAKIEDYIKMRETTGAEHLFKADDWLRITQSGIIVHLRCTDPEIVIRPVFAKEDIGSGPGMDITVGSMKELEEICEMYYKIQREK